MVQLTTPRGVCRTLLALATAIVALMTFAAAGQAADPCAAPVTNPVACENSKPGDAAERLGGRPAPATPTIQGFATSMSVNDGQTISFKIKTPASAYHIDILRLGYYGGDGARHDRRQHPPSASLPQTSRPASPTRPPG